MKPWLFIQQILLTHHHNFTFSSFRFFLFLLNFVCAISFQIFFIQRSVYPTQQVYSNSHHRCPHRLHYFSLHTRSMSTGTTSASQASTIIMDDENNFDNYHDNNDGNKPSTSQTECDNQSNTNVGAKVSKKISKQIYTCGKNYEAAMKKLFDHYPCLAFHDLEQTIEYISNTNIGVNNSNEEKWLEWNINRHLFDATRPICATIDVLAKANQPLLGLKLLDQVLCLIQIYFESKDGSVDQKNHEDECIIKSKKNAFLHLIYKSIIGMMGQTIPKQSKNESDADISSRMNGEYILQILYYDIPIQTCDKHNYVHRNAGIEFIQQKLPPNIDLYHSTVSALGKCKRMDLIMKIIHDMESNLSIQVDLADTSYNNPSFEYRLPKPDQTLYSTALTAAIRSKAYNESVQILQHMKKFKQYPNILSYNQVLSCISNAGSMFGNSDERFLLTKKILEELENYNYSNQQRVIPNQSTYQIVMAIYAKESRWDDIKDIKLKMMKNPSSNTTIFNSDTTDSSRECSNTPAIHIERRIPRGSVASIHGKEMTLDATIHSDESIVLNHMNDLKQLRKVTNKRPVWYMLGKYSASDENDSNDISFIFGIQTHRNPSENGISMVFHEEKSMQKLGYMLIRNAVGPRQRHQIMKGRFEQEDFILYSSFMGMFIDDKQRGKKLAIKFMAIWLLICIKSNALPLTEIINKPLLSLVLTNLGFIPSNDEIGIEVEICPLSSIEDKPEEKNRDTGWYPEFAMYSKGIRPDDGTFGDRELRVQKMMITKYEPNPRGKVTFVKTSFDHPMVHAFKANGMGEEFDKTKTHLMYRVQDILDQQVSLFENDHLLRRAVFGFLYQDTNI